MRQWIRYHVAAVGLLACAQACAASNVLIWPIDPYLAADANATELWIQNQGTSVTTMQVRVIGWEQQGGHERYQQQQDVVASPPIVSVQGGSKQLIRLIKQKDVPAGRELAYRIVVDEIPQSTDDSKPQMGLKLQMRYSIPLFSYGRGIATQKAASHHAFADTNKLSWRVINDNGKPALQVSNRGDVHVRLSKAMLKQGSQQRVLADGLMGYVLANSERVWPLPASLTRPTQLSATINAPDAVWQSAPVN